MDLDASFRAPMLGHDQSYKSGLATWEKAEAGSGKFFASLFQKG
jgi:hypothetical protein